jgi:hypothetical protein
MPKSVSRLAAAALQAGKKYSNGKNTKVDSTGLYLFGNHIARDAGEGHVAISNRGWFTLTTKDRLNALCNVGISQRKGKWYLNGFEWDGSWVIVAPDGTWKPELQF